MFPSVGCCDGMTQTPQVLEEVLVVLTGSSDRSCPAHRILIELRGTESPFHRDLHRVLNLLTRTLSKGDKYSPGPNLVQLRDPHLLRLQHWASETLQGLVHFSHHLSRFFRQGVMVTVDSFIGLILTPHA